MPVLHIHIAVELFLMSNWNFSVQFKAVTFSLVCSGLSATMDFSPHGLLFSRLKNPTHYIQSGSHLLKWWLFSPPFLVLSSTGSFWKKFFLKCRGQVWTHRWGFTSTKDEEFFLCPRYDSSVYASLCTTGFFTTVWHCWCMFSLWFTLIPSPFSVNLVFIHLFPVLQLCNCYFPA